MWRNGEPALRAGMPMRLAPMPGVGLAPRMASVTIGGVGVRTVSAGSLVGTTLPSFHAPIAGQAAPRRWWWR